VLVLAAFLQAAAASPRPITESVEKVIDHLEEEQKNPCLKAARENVPCFPVKSEKKGFDHRLDAARYQGDIAFLGRFDGECEAQAAYRREQRRTPEGSAPPP